MSLNSTLKLTYLPVPLPSALFSKCMSTSGFLTVIVVPSFETSVGAFSTVGVSSVALAVASAAGASVVASDVGATVSEAGASVVVSVAGATVSVVGCVADTSSAWALGAMIASRAAVKITPQRPYALDFLYPSLMFLFVIINLKTPL